MLIFSWFSKICMLTLNWNLFMFTHGTDYISDEHGNQNSIQRFVVDSILIICPSNEMWSIIKFVENLWSLWVYKFALKLYDRRLNGIKMIPYPQIHLTFGTDWIIPFQTQYTSSPVKIISAPLHHLFRVDIFFFVGNHYGW